MTEALLTEAEARELVFEYVKQYCESWGPIKLSFITRRFAKRLRSFGDLEAFVRRDERLYASIARNGAVVFNLIDRVGMMDLILDSLRVNGGLLSYFGLRQSLLKRGFALEDIESTVKGLALTKRIGLDGDDVILLE